MSSMRVGVQARIKKRAPLAMYVHCNSHVLNLCIAAAYSEKIAEHIGTEITRPRITSRQRHRANAESDNTEEYFRRNIAIPFCDILKTEMAVRFQTEDRKGATLFELLPVQITQLESADDLVTSLMLLEDDLLTPSSLRTEILLWKRLWEGQNVCDYPESLHECLKTIDEDVFPNVKHLKVACTLSISSCETERSFSTLRRTKTYLRNTMGEERLSGLVLMNVHHQDLKIDVGEICQIFISKNTRRMFEKCILNINKA
ncbi:Hypothetical predicted protein [Mytilus galloprovincialis]|uniref:HAT C-terminal dimerisation domain-containing protein n=1 Tax=Mytilus galloprovincialis TaxID=29158 RepID=A0A8B6H853_MYTGA|nr:Hypothetical predicted protein [Mytilus galloprovincialis]